MEVIYTPHALEDLKYWKKTGNKTIQKKIAQLIIAIQNDPFNGIRKPEPLKYELSGFWSRRINSEHRIVYQIFDENDIMVLEIQSLKGHY
ncbi:MAG: yoeB 2 [Mucilaginibacter sp.]|jgi:toxin YoeB|nr:yoeB 2 [Mucilaginibacter sp.]